MKLLYDDIFLNNVEFTDSDPRRLQDILRSLKQAEIFRIQNVADYYWYGTGQEFWGANDFINLAPPFENFWMEYTIPSFVNRNGTLETNENANLKVGILFNAKKFQQSGKNLWAMNAVALIPVRNIINSSTFQIYLLVDDDGRLITKDGETAFGAFLSENIALDSEIKEQFLDEVASIINPALLAITFLHCKNVKIIDQKPKHGNRSNRKQSKITFHTLEIEPMKRVLRSEGNSESVGLKKAMHICRGHFKDFREGRGLFGQFHDIYWWDSQVRGSSEAGIVLKDYDIKEPKNP